MSITVPSAGDGISASWGQSVANQLNSMVPWTLSADLSNNSTSMTDVMTMPVSSGVTYSGELYIRFGTGGVSTGLVYSLNGPTATAMWYVEYYDGNSGGGVATRERSTTYDGGSGITTTDSTNVRMAVLRFWVQPSASGTLAIRTKRTGTSTSTTTYKGSGGIVTIQT